MQNILLKMEELVKSIHKNAAVTMVPDQIKGHFATNLLLIAKDSEKELRNILSPYVQEFTIVDGFLNMTLKPEYYQLEFYYNFGKGEKISLEYCSPNPTGPLHLGHCRNIVVGKTMDNLLRFCNYDVVSDLYMNDCGNQINDFLETIAYYKDLEEKGESQRSPKYLGEYMKDLAKSYSVEEVLNKQIEAIIDKLEKIGIKYDRIKKESTLQMEPVIETLRSKGLLQEKDGKIWCGGKVVCREDGSYTYFAGDIAYHLFKSRKTQVIVLGEDQRGNFSHLQTLLKELGINLNIILIGTVHIRSGGEILKLSKREGNIVTLDQILAEMSLGEVFCSLLDANLHKSILIDRDSRTLDNTMFHLTYLHRILPDIDTHQNPFDQHDNWLLGQLLFWPKALRDSVILYNPHKFFIFVKLSLASIYKYISERNRIPEIMKRNIISIINCFMDLVHN